METSKTNSDAISYIRFSSLEQGNGDSYRRQMGLTRTYCEQNNLTLIDEQADKGVSAYKGANSDEGALSEIIRRAKEGHYAKGTVLIVESLDRISRQEINKALRLFLEILDSGLDIVTLSDGEKRYRHDNTQLPDLLLSLVVMSRAHEESETKSKRISASWSNKREQARSTGKAMTAICPNWLKMVNGKYEVIQDRAEVIRAIFILSLDFNQGSQAIATELNNQGIKPWGISQKRNKTGLWGKSYITKILQNPAVYGCYQPCKKVRGKRVPTGEEFNDYYPAIVEKSVFDQNRSKRRNRKIIDTGRAASVVDYNIYRGIAFCLNCGNSLQMTSKIAKGIGYRYMICSGKCGMKPARFDKFERLILDFIPNVDLTSISSSLDEQLKRNQAREGLIIEKKEVLKMLTQKWQETNSPTILDFIAKTESEITDIEFSMEYQDSPIDSKMAQTLGRASEYLDSEDPSWRFECRQNIVRIIKRIEYSSDSNCAAIYLTNGNVLNVLRTE
jgi:DNA invertase Pin-like site-specific DNA recombinase